MGFFGAGRMIEGYGRLKLGMPENEVLDLLGEPTGVRKRGGVTTYSWQNSEFKGVLRGGTVVRKIFVDIEDGVVVGYDSENMDRSRW